MNKYIDRDKLAEFARHSTIGIDANDIMRFPTADVVEVKHGEWEERFEYQHEKFCSNCGIPQLWMNAVVYNFCPNCGADMRGRKETE